MIGFVRKIVAGPKNRTRWNGIDLDLTYITQRIIAMAFPASGFEKTYRNSIDDVSEYFKEKHQGHCLVINVSMREYEYKMFGNLVKDYFWPDHQAPPLTTMFIICQDMLDYLRKTLQGVVAVHCNHGKGRTGTTIIAYMLFTRQFKDADEALTFYNKRRFIIDTYGVDQPCQRRYLDYVQRILHMKQIPKTQRAYKLVKVLQAGLHVQDHYIQISLTRNCQTKHTKIKVNQIFKNNTIPLIGDIFIELYEHTWSGETQAARINYNLTFLQKTKDGLYFAQFKGEDIKVNGKHKINFMIALFFEIYCDCHKSQQLNKACECYADRQRQQQQWNKMKQIVDNSKSIPQSEMDKYVYGINQKKLQNKQQQTVVIQQRMQTTHN